MNANDLVKKIIGEAIYIHKRIGPGLLENVYQTCLAYRLRQSGLYVETEKPVPDYFEEVRMDCGYRSDLVVENLVVVDTKSVEALAPVHTAQILTYLRFLEMKHGLILNFNVNLMKDGIKRVILGYGN